ncbi:MAG: hypothetical protein JW750_11450 [Anaerolineaceae bacterium]|nr:hypothetical protein [Anaerolineaceae bacterium]
MAETAANEKQAEKKPEVQDQTIVTEHTAQVDGRTIEYRVTTGTMVLKEENSEDGQKPKASVFYVAYELKTYHPKIKRPVTFSFNGGPGSSSVWMHMGLLGPKRVRMDDDGMPLKPPYELVDNDYTLLEETDLVFIDPVSTGFSRTVPGEKAEQFHTQKKDVESVGDFIHLYTTRNNRWASPKFLIGESYGTTRAAGLSGYLQDRHGLYLNGIMLISSILNFITARFNPGNDLPYILFLPTYTATAWYHQKLDAELQQDLQKTLAEVEAFAANEYTLALMKGSTLSLEERTQIIQKLARYTGLSEEYIDRTDLRVNIFRFCKELRRDEGLTVGRLDSRFIGQDRDAAGEMFERDPSHAAINGPYSAMFKDYVRRELKFESDLPYEIIASIFQTWKYDTWENQYVNVAEVLREAMLTNPELKVFVANGFYDLATPYFATQYTFNHLGIPQNLADNISMSYYEAGHMMYLHIDSLKKLKQDLIGFLQQSIPE